MKKTKLDLNIEIRQEIESLKKQMRAYGDGHSPAYPADIKLARSHIANADLILGYIVLKQVYGIEAATNLLINY